MWRLAICIAFMAVLSKFYDIPSYLLIIFGTMVYILSGGWRWLMLVSKTIKRDMIFIKVGLFALLRGLRCLKKKAILGDIFSDNVRKHPDKLAFVSAENDMSLTFKEAEQLSHKIANIFYSSGYRKGDVVVLLMENRIEYIPIWLGFTMIGVITSLINYNLRGDSLKHCISVCNCKAVIFTKEMSEPLKEIVDELKASLYCYDKCENIRDDVTYLGCLLESATYLPPPKFEELSLKDEILYMYTSGTTGLPKAAIIRSAKCVFFCFGVNESVGIDKNDVIYNALPLYHGNGGLMMACQVIVNGATLVIKKRFSASRYMNDCRTYNVTVINYIGETCRYLLSQPKSDLDKINNIRIAIGNGLRSSIWEEFKDRFNIPLIVEIYGSTEGNTALMNTEGRRGAIGFNLVIFPNLLPMKLVKVDKDTGEIIRKPNGLAVEAKPGEPGQIVGKIRNDNIFQFDGYLNKVATQKKIAHDIFSKGDSVFLSGDILTQDEEGYYYFHDRTGDTFRWKGENVSTNEVEGVISKALQLTDVCVYAAEIPGIEGKAGMACICDPDRKVNIEELHMTLERALPQYAQPIFLRMTTTIEVTGTYKFQKNKLREEGFNPDAILKEDELFYFNNEQRKYLPLDAYVYQQISNQQIRF